MVVKKFKIENSETDVAKEVSSIRKDWKGQCNLLILFFSVIASFSILSIEQLKRTEIRKSTCTSIIFR